MPKRALLAFSIYFLLLLVVGGIVFFSAASKELIHWDEFGKAAAFGGLIGAGLSLWYVGLLTKRITDNKITKFANDWLTGVLIVGAIVFYPELSGFVCKLIEESTEKCLSMKYGFYEGALFAAALTDVIWAFLWEKAHRQPLYFE
ncbi:hypothetical protein [Nitrospira sp. BLG_1]|uniref:hypothetical protein n=1 Tax=Nitrospira sp. BLG_1 TaxID=3395883 RepID=UPI0039BD3819